MKHLLNSFMLFLILFIGHSSYVKGDTTIASGTIDGTSIKWSVTSPDGTQENLKLSVTGSGAIPSYQSDFSPWEKYNHKTTEIYVAPTITEIGDYAFFETAITSFEIPSSCTRIGASAFLRCTNLKEIYIPSNVEIIGALAFRGCTSLSLIHYDGRCTSNTIISSNVNDLGVANGKIIEKEGTGASYAFIPEGWEYYTHGEQCNGGAWVAESGTKLFFYAQKPNASVNYASAETLTSDQQDLPQYHPWRANSDKYTSIEINRNISTFGNYELMGYTDSNTGIVKGYSNLQTITVESENPIYIVGEDGALYNDVKSKLFLYPAQNPATHFDVPVTVGSIRPGAFCDAKNLQSVSFHSTLKNVWISQHAFANASSLSYISFASETIPAQYYLSSFVGLPRDGVVVAPTETDEFKRLTQYITSAVGSNWTFATGSGNVVSYLSSDGTLYVAGNGEYTTSSSNASWYSQRNSIKKIVVKEGITNIGIRAFSGCTNVTEVLTRVNIGTGHIVFSTYSSSSPFDGCSKLSVVNVADFASFCKITNLNYLTDSYYGTAEEKTLMVNGVTHDPSSELVIPEGVTSISKDQFGYFKNVTKIRIPSTVTEIRERKCANCKYLTEITIPSTVNSVGQEAFYGCTALKTVTLNNTGTIGVSAFNGCTALKTVTINNTCTIGIRAFSGCTNVTEVTLNNTGSIEALAFEYCTSLTRVNIGTGLIEFCINTSSSPFDGCSKLATINVTDLAKYCSIKNLKYLTDSSYGTAANKTLMVNGGTHSSSRNLEIPEGVTEISQYAFRYFSNVTAIKLPESMKTISSSNFYGHTYLETIILPATVTSVGSSAFSGCSNLEYIICQATACPSVTSSIATNPGKITLKVPRGKASLYKAANVWKDFNVEELIYNVENMDLYDYGMLTSNGYLMTRLSYNNYQVWSWTSTNPDVAKMIGTVLYVKDYVYDGTTAKPYKEFSVIADLGDCDTCVWNIRLYPREVELIDGNAYKNTEDFSINGKISYTRSFSSNVKGHWQCFYVPFDIEITDELLDEFEFAKLYMVSYYDSNDNGVIEDNEPLKMILSRLSAGMTLHANKPYYIKPKNACTKTFEATNTVLKAAENGSVRCCTTEHEYSLVGINETTNIKGMYSMNTKGQFVYCKSDANIKANRWYMEVKSLTEYGAENENYARPIQIVIDGEEETTGIASLEDNVYASKNDKIYTLDGRQVTDYDNLPSGIYIINGKKVFKK